jgi:hypothetical protein
MTSLRKLRILVKDADVYYKYANVDWLDGGQGLLLYDYYTGEKLSRHPNQIFLRVPGSGQHQAPSTAIPFSSVDQEVIRQVAIPSDLTTQLPKYQGDPADCFVFSSTVISSNGTFAAELVRDSGLQATLAAWERHPEFVSAQTCRANTQGQSVILTLLNKRST